MRRRRWNDVSLWGLALLIAIQQVPSSFQEEQEKLMIVESISMDNNHADEFKEHQELSSIFDDESGDFDAVEAASPKRSMKRSSPEDLVSGEWMLCVCW